MNAYRKSPAFRMGLRTVVVAVATYITSALADENAFVDLKSFGLGLLGAAITATIGLLTPVEPFVGVGKPDNVEVPAEKAVPS